MTLLFAAAALSLAACSSSGGAFDLGAPAVDARRDAPAFQSCDTFCLRPTDCAVGFASDGICPAGFLCARTFQCAGDGGTRD